MKGGLTSAWTREFRSVQVVFTNGMRSLPRVVLQRKDCRENVREIPLLVARNKIKIDYYYWFSVSYRLVSEIGNPEIVYFSTTKHLKRQKRQKIQGLLSTFASDRVYLGVEK